MLRVAGLNSAAKRLAITASNHRGETLQRWQAVGDTVANFNSPVIKPQTTHTEDDANTEKISRLKPRLHLA